MNELRKLIISCATQFELDIPFWYPRKNEIKIFVERNMSDWAKKTQKVLSLDNNFNENHRILEINFLSQIIRI